ncbi:hypothetical protein BGW36DRAFT_361930 [Talaromyces proteolyticus]|uniref:HNH nuclease domain-containing protein n=1 Tax=Talaromyces proteolyticus TaxID=1131652 RepID=A0AAD4KLI2_9EURO|nr:uncharacterized protein BGW36DRAFT_361930 [Talaromyces proteolyticus]KAH8694108.1 hypothetical protein BGW36DRAFT_361930 [Talaromyces proteolyticus]
MSHRVPESGDNDSPGLEFAQEERHFLLNQISDILFHSTGCNSVQSSTWVLLLLSDVENLRKMVDDHQNDSDGLHDLLTGPHKDNLVRMWMSRVGDQFTISAPPSGAVSPSKARESKKGSVAALHTPLQLSSAPSTPASAKRDSKIRHQAIVRDAGCIITRSQSPHVLKGAHVFPVSMAKHIGRWELWSTLKIFWSKDKVNSWYNVLNTSPDPGITPSLFIPVRLSTALR